ncbi:MAG: hypothetical protein NTU50_07895 [Actinobacteria bacterium]|nr:hypothetical protein [Actinomycetota bacterium]
MPRGNDDSAARDLAAKHGEGVGNAEQLIEATQAARSDELDAAQMKSLDVDATAALDPSDFAGPNGEAAVSVAVRGGATIVVYEDDKGGYSKCVVGEGKKSRPAKAKKPAADKE